MCGGIGAGLEAVLRAGIRINRYKYADIDRQARRVIQFKLENLSARYPNLLPITAWQEAFSLPQDVTQIHDVLELARGAARDEQWLVTAGWPCQDYSSAGRGRLGVRAHVLDSVTRIIAALSLQFHKAPPAYLLENVAMQHNFSHKHIRYPVYEDLCRRLGDPVTFDAAQAGSHAHRMRNYWTNLADDARLQNVLDCLDVPRGNASASTILKSGRVAMPVAPNERSHSGRQYNVPGQPRVKFPTLMSYRGSRAFRPGKAGSVYDHNLDRWTEPDADERELAMGYELGSTAVEGVSSEKRRQLLSQAIDLNALFAILLAAEELSEAGQFGGQEVRAATAVDAQTFRVCSAAAFAEDSELDAPPPRKAGEELTGRVESDIWSDGVTMGYLRDGKLPEDKRESNRVRRNARLCTVGGTTG